MERIKKVALEIKQKLTKSESEKLMIEIINSQESLSKESLYTIVEKCKVHESRKDVMKILADNLRVDHKKVSQLNRSLEVIEGLITLASFEVINEFRNALEKFRALVDFNPENKSLEQCGLVREQARKVVELLINDDHLIDVRKNAMSLRMRSVAPSTADYANTNKGNMIENNEHIIREKSTYAPPTIFLEKQTTHTQEKSQKAALGSKSLFDGLKFKNDSNFDISPMILSRIVKKDGPSDMPSPIKTESNNSSAIEHIPLQKISKSTKTELFGIPLKKHTTEKNITASSQPENISLPIGPIIPNASNKISTIEDFSLYSLDIEPNIQVSQPVTVKPAPVIFENLKFTQMKSENNNFMPDAFDLADFPLINAAPKPTKTVPIHNLEAILMNIDGLECSLSLSKRPNFRSRLD